VHSPIVAVQAPPLPDERRFYQAILAQVFAPFRPSKTAGNLQFEVVQLLSTVGVKMLIIDEIQHVLAGPMLRQRHFLNVIKYLGNELQIPIVAAGTHDAFNAIQTDPQLSNRFEPALLRRWTLTDEYLRLLASFEVALPLERPSRLADRAKNPGSALQSITTSARRSAIRWRASAAKSSALVKRGVAPSVYIRVSFRSDGIALRPNRAAGMPTHNDDGRLRLEPRSSRQDRAASSAAARRDRGAAGQEGANGAPGQIAQTRLVCRATAVCQDPTKKSNRPVAPPIVSDNLVQ
jgi:Bacterial TniB protein